MSLADGLSKRHKQQFIVENKPGAAGTTGIDLIAKIQTGWLQHRSQRRGPDRDHSMIDPTLPYNPARTSTPLPC